MNNGAAGLKSYRQLGRWVTWIAFGSNSIGAFLSYFYFAYIAPLPESGAALADVSWVEFIPTAIGIALLLAVGSFMGRHGEKHFPKWLDRVLDGASHKEVPEEAKREALQHPYWTALTSLTMWFIAGTVFGLMAGSVRAFWGIFFVGGILTSASTYLALEALWRRVIPLFFPEEGLQTAKVFYVPILPRLLLTFFLVSVYPLGMMVLLSLDRARSILFMENPEFYMRNLVAAEVFIFMIAAVSSVLMAWLVTRSIVSPLTDLQAAMRRVAKNDLEASIPLKSNDEMGLVTEHFNDMLGGLRRGELLRNLLNLYVSPEVAQEALEHGANLGGQLVECTVLFSDLRSFTALSEQLPPNELILLLNRYMQAMVEVVVAEGGMVNKFGGDSLLAIFGTPINPSRVHASSAVRTALGMRSALADFNRKQSETGGPQLRCGIGVATGNVVAGNVGGRERIEYTVIGDTVNLAARLQSMCKELGHDILLSAEAYAHASREMELHAEEIPNITVRGKAEPVTIYVL